MQRNGKYERNTVSFSVRLSRNRYEMLGSNKGKALNDILDRYENILRCGGAELDSIFVDAEWKFILESVGTIDLQGPFRLSPDYLVMCNRDAEKYRRLATTMSVDLDSINEKCMKLSPIGMETLCCRVERHYRASADCCDVTEIPATLTPDSVNGATDANAREDVTDES